MGTQHLHETSAMVWLYFGHSVVAAADNWSNIAAGSMPRIGFITDKAKPR
jgi:hypothetical protein